ncbi:Panacea domain-containing protein [Luteimonas salinilitoris]|uniref:Panacea domain-containing protein n=1 Tax=Luteimonas salinilitoris TaxID=3237697 RepID=A0ABV4HXY6_9GAMM
MTFDGRAIANYVLDASEAAGRPVTNLGLQKLVYFCHAWSLTILGGPLIRHQFEAWQFGPVLQYLYRDFKIFDRKPITTRAQKLNPGTGFTDTVGYVLDEETAGLLEKVVGFYGRLSAGTLVELSHAEGSPWDHVWRHEGRVNPGMRISDELIRQYYSRTPPPF